MYFINFANAVQRSSAENCIIHQKASVVESFLSLVKLDSVAAVFMTNFQNIFRTTLQKQLWAAVSVVLM